MTPYSKARQLTAPLILRQHEVLAAETFLSSHNTKSETVTVSQDALATIPEKEPLICTVSDVSEPAEGDPDEIDDEAAVDSGIVASSPFRSSILTVGDDVRTTLELLDNSTMQPGPAKAHFKLGD
jgi:hypothetical protein